MTMSLSLSTSASWLLVAGTGVLVLLVLVLGVLVLRLGSRLAAVEGRLKAAGLPSSDPAGRSAAVEKQPSGSLDAAEPAREYVITHVGEPVTEVAEPVEPAGTLPAPVFADLLLKETVVQTASFFHGLRRALAPETRNRIRFQMRQEVKRSRKQRRTELREVRREWAARQRTAMPAEDAGTAA